LQLTLREVESKSDQEGAVMKNGHVGLYEDKHYYRVPYNYIGKKVHYYILEDILKKGLDKLSAEEDVPAQKATPAHQNVRGKSYYQQQTINLPDGQADLKHQ
jgi:hypothetical protein